MGKYAVSHRTPETRCDSRGCAGGGENDRRAEQSRPSAAKYISPDGKHVAGAGQRAAPVSHVCSCLRCGFGDAGALGFTLLIAVLTGIVFGLTPAIRASALSLPTALKESGRGSSQGKRHGWIRGALVACEVAFTCVLLVGAGLLIRSFLRVLDVDLGFQPRSAGALRIDPSRQNSTQALRNAYIDDALRRVNSAPGIEGAGLTDTLPLGGNRSWSVAAKGKTYERGKYPEAFVRIVSDGYLRAMGTPLRAGRDFSAADNPSSPRVIIIPGDICGCASSSYGCSRAGRLSSRETGVTIGPGRGSARRIKEEAKKAKRARKAKKNFCLSCPLCLFCFLFDFRYQS
ncbi:MAG: hypothetical protein MOB07_01250 [Acidobacteria bacterium]|nr:hypothetical protein [Acidobacteriota bacterium]